MLPEQASWAQHIYISAVKLGILTLVYYTETRKKPQVCSGPVLLPVELYQTLHFPEFIKDFGQGIVNLYLYFSEEIFSPWPFHSLKNKQTNTEYH